MKTILVFAGTTEGRQIVEILEHNRIACHVCVATEYGSQMMESNDYVTVHVGRLDATDMKALMHEIDCELVIDATHPYAIMVTKTIKKSIEGTGIGYLRLQRQDDVVVEQTQVLYYENEEECASYLSTLPGRILLTTGSKKLSAFTYADELKERLVVRVIPGMESLQLCYDAGLSGNQIIAMQGPFSQEMNEAMLKTYGIRHLVTKQSGTTGGVEQKLLAARKLGVQVHMIRKPMEATREQDNEGLSLQELVVRLEKTLGRRFEHGKLQIALVGIGPGKKELMTQEALGTIQEADVIFGAKRMLAAIDTKGENYSYYQKEDILPVLEKIEQESYSDKKVAILFSGDTGFYSGCKKIQEALRTYPSYEVRVIPGVSSLSLLCAKCGIDWQDGKIISLHGKKPEEWEAFLLDAIKYHSKTFFIASGVADIRKIGSMLSDDKHQLCLGYQLSYPNERVLRLLPSECIGLSEEGLYAGVIFTKNVEERFLVPTLDDSFFIRNQVPMTKEDVRKLSICQLKIKEKDVVYDIGSGSGSIAVSIGVLSPTVKVYALECNQTAVELIQQNIQKAELRNVSIIETMAPLGLKELPKANSAFIGGSKGKMREILSALYESNPAMRVVINAVSMESICELHQILGEFPIKNLVVKQLSINQTRQLGEYHLLCANNPVFLFAFDFTSKER